MKETEEVKESWPLALIPLAIAALPSLGSVAVTADYLLALLPALCQGSLKYLMKS
jgi:hypothetical protein